MSASTRKKICGTLAAVTLLAVLLTLSAPLCLHSSAVWNGDVLTDGDWQYTISGKTARIVGYLGNDAEVTVPAKIGKYAVKEFFANLEHDQTIRAIRLQKGIETVSNYACRFLEALETVELPDTLKEIGYEAFFRCPNLREFRIPASVTLVQDRAFEESAFHNDPGNWEDGMLYADGVLLKARSDLVGATGRIREGTRVIKGSVFWGFLKMTSVELPSTLKYIGMGAFSQSGLVSVEIPANVREIQKNAFSTCQSLETVTFASGSRLQTIGVSAFGNCRLLNHLRLPAGLRSIEDSAFSNCGFLEDIELPEGITHIGQRAFWQTKACNNAKPGVSPFSISGYLLLYESIIPVFNVPEGTAAICSNSCTFLTRLTEMTIPKSVQLIEEDAFASTNNIKKITYAGSESAWKKLAGHAFDHCKQLKVICLEKDVHEHVYSEWTVDREPTCEENGEKTRVCETCGEKETVPVEKTGHRYENGVCVLCGRLEDGFSDDPAESVTDPAGEVTDDAGDPAVPSGDDQTEDSEVSADDPGSASGPEDLSAGGEPVPESAEEVSDEPEKEGVQPLPFIIGGSVLLAAGAVGAVFLVKKRFV